MMSSATFASAAASGAAEGAALEEDAVAALVTGAEAEAAELRVGGGPGLQALQAASARRKSGRCDSCANMARDIPRFGVVVHAARWRYSCRRTVASPTCSTTTIGIAVGRRHGPPADKFGCTRRRRGRRRRSETSQGILRRAAG